MPLQSHKELIVWQKSVLISEKIYTLTEKFPKTEVYGLVSQMQRAAVSVASNIAEGRNRGTRKEFIQFLRIAFGSVAELETQIEIAKRLKPTKDLYYEEIDILLNEVSRMLASMIKKLAAKS